MTKNIKAYSRFMGISDFTRESLVVDAYASGRSVDIRTDPQTITLLPRTVKESGNVVIDLPKWADSIPSSLDTYLYGNAGNIYKRTSARSYTNLRTVPNSHGNGLGYFAEDDFVYYTSDKVLGRYGPISSSTPQFVDDWLGSQGGVPLNTNSLDLESSSSQYADRADTASLSVTGNLSIRAQVYPESLPTVGNSMTIVSKWNESGATRSYKMDMAAVSGYFGDGTDGALTISGNTTETPIDSACTGTSGAYSLSATNASFATGQQILIHQSQGTGAGTWQRNSISSYTAGTITLGTALNATYVSGAQVRTLPQYTNVTINSGITYTAKAWNGTVGGILAFIASGTVTVTGNISASEKGFRGPASGANGTQGEGYLGTGNTSETANGNGGAAAQARGGAGGGGNGTAGSQGGDGSGAPDSGGRPGGSAYGSADLTTMTFGGAGGTGKNTGPAGNGGGIVFLTGATITVTGTVVSGGGTGASVSLPQTDGACGGGAGGSILLKAQTATLGSALITASGGSGGSGNSGAGSGGSGGSGRVHLDYYTSYTGTTTPTLDVTQDNTLVTNTTYQLRLAVSSTGSNSETLAFEINPQTATWQQIGVSWTASTSTATFYFNGVSLGTRTGTLTAIHDNASRFAVGANFNGAGSAANFYDGLIDEVQVFNTTQSASDFFFALSQQISTTTAGLVAYYKFNGNANDATANANNLTEQGSPVYTTNVPFPSPTTRLDIDQSATTAGNTYTTPTAINENSTNRKTFTPAKDPQKSVAVLVAAKGTGAWTITIHDAFNNTIATSTITNANMTTGYVEFTYASLWRPLTGFTNSYHFHITSTVADGTVTTTTASDLETVSFRTYYQFLMTDTEYHPIARMLQFLVIGNERWVAKLEATLYEPNLIALPAGYRVRSFAYWNEYLAIGTWRGSSITDFDSGRVYFWDGIAPTYNFFIDVPEGGINALFGTPGKLYIWAGYQGDMLVYQGGSNAQKIKRLPKITPQTYVEIAPGAVNMWQALIRFGASINSDSTVIEKAVYTYGSTNVRYPEILTEDYPISTGNYLNTVSIGLVYPVGQDLMIGWQDNVSYGVDYINADNNVYPTGTVEFLINDDDEIWRQKEANTLVANLEPLVSGQSVSLKYKVDNASSFTSTQDSTSADDTVARLVIPDGRYNQVQVAIDLATSVSTSPTINGVALERDLEEQAGRVG